MKKVAGMDVELTVEERNLLSVAYKNVIGRFNLFDNYVKLNSSIRR